MRYAVAGSRVVIAALIGLLVLSCSSSIQVPPPRDGKRYYGGFNNALWEAAVQACGRLAWEVISADRDTGVLVARCTSATAGARHPKVRVLFTADFEGGTTVELTGVPGSGPGFDELRVRAREFFAAMDSVTESPGYGELPELVKQ